MKTTFRVRASVVKTKQLVPGELEAATILGQFGEVPQDFAESVQGG